jgi:DNA-directed RNA polymerase beta subunit
MDPALANHNKPVCLICGRSDQIYDLQVPRVFRYLAAELSSVGIKMQCKISDPKHRGDKDSQIVKVEKKEEK